MTALAPMAPEKLSTALHAELVSPHFVELIPRDFARQHLIVSQGEQGEADAACEILAVAESTPKAAILNAGTRLGRCIQTRIADGEAIARVIDLAYGRPFVADDQDAVSSVGAVPSGEVDLLLAQADRDLLSTQGKGPVIKLVDALLFEALGRSASDVHVQPLADGALVRYRLDGVLHTVRELPRNLVQPVISRIKVMGRMDIAERRIPQDGRASVTIGDRSIDLRISTLPTSFGERAVIRLLDNSNHLCDFAALGMPLEVATPYLERSGRANGLILLTGPTGSGKTTTLYSTLRRVGSDQLNIMTIEDPIEYELSSMGVEGKVNISQAQVNLKKGVTFASGLRHILRQDPDVIMVGEIRDAETAKIAVQSSLTGHLVFSTLHTNDAASAVTRLIDLGVESYLVSASLSAVLAQRLVRTFHNACGGAGCDACLGTGFKGRTGLFELLLVDETIRELLSRQFAVGNGMAGGGETSLGEIRRVARAAGMRTLREDGERLIAANRTSRAEVARVVEGAV